MRTSLTFALALASAAALSAQNSAWNTTAGSFIGIGITAPQYPFHLHGTTDYIVFYPAEIGGPPPQTINYGKTSRMGFTNTHTGVGSTSRDGAQLRLTQKNFIIENLEEGNIALETGSARLTLNGTSDRAFFGSTTTGTEAAYLNVRTGIDNGLYINTQTSGHYGLSVKTSATDNAIQVVSGTANSFSVKGTGQVKILTSGLASGDDIFLVENETRRLLQLENSGLLYAREIKVNADTWADYVFEPGYDLLPLREVESYIQTEGHLPNVPSATTVLCEGINVAEMNTLLLEKIEELTLYIIAQEKRITELENQLQK